MAGVNLPEGSEELAQHLNGLNDTQLAELETQLVSEFDSLYGEDEGASVDAEGLARLGVLAGQIEAIRTEGTTRETEAAERATQVANLRTTVHGNNADPEDEETSTDEGAPAEEQDDDTQEQAVGDPGIDKIAAAIAQAITAAIEPARKVPVENVLKDGKRSLNQHLSLGAAQRRAPDANVPTGRPGMVFAASSDIPGFTQGSSIGTVGMLADAMNARARALPIAHGNGARVPVASLRREFRYNLSTDATPEQVSEILTAAMNVENLVAAGGWCAPSEINYDFFNIIAEDGMLDLPTAGVLNRGGIRYPVSPTLNDIVTASPDGLWTWTETDDQSAVTGAPVKDCVRVPCPSFAEDRLVCEGLCVTAGNLVDYAYPENVQNFIKLITAARAHLTNTRIIGLLATGSTAVAMTSSTTGNPETDSVIATILNALDLQATDTRNKFGMPTDAVIEAVLPSWIEGAFRSDFTRRTGIDNPWLTDAMMLSAFDMRNVRVQFVQDWQVRASGKPGFSTPNTAWPATVQMLIYAPGTWLRGQGLTLDLGVVRDSVLNATNDHTAAWMEDCYSVSKVGHESRLVTTNICVAGTTGAANVAC